MRAPVMFVILVLASGTSSADEDSQAEPPAKLHLTNIQLEPIVLPPTVAPSTELRPISIFAQDGKVGLGAPRNEKRAGLGLGDDRLWKVHALQVGGMVTGFAALAALCGSGNCMLPNWANGWLPWGQKEYQHPMLDRGPNVGALPSLGRDRGPDKLPR